MNWELEFAQQISSFWGNNPSLDWLTYIFGIITTLSEYGLFSILCGIVFLFFKKTRRMGIICLASLTLFALLGNSVITKHTIMRIRPVWDDPTGVIQTNAERIFLPIEARWLNLDFWALPKPTSYSFMSGHTVAITLLATVIFLHHKKIGIFVFLFAILTGFTRIYFAFHYVSDVLAGFIYGIAGGLITYLAYYKLEPIIKNLFKKKDSNNA